MPNTAYKSAQSVALTASLSTTPVIHFGPFRTGRILNRSGGAVTITVYECEEAQGTYVKCDDVGTAGALSAIDNNESLALPTALEGCNYLKFVASSGTPTVVLAMKD
mgnify:CR=1 FL=1